MKTAYPLDWPVGWPRTSKPKPSRFGDWNKKPTVNASRQKLENEIRLMGGKDMIISSNIKLRLDGLPRSGQKDPEDSGIAVYFVRNGEMVVLACDTYDRCGCNLWSIAKTIEAMRGIDRWGCSELLNRAFSGFKAIGETSSTSEYYWYDILEVDPNCTIEELKTAYKAKAKIHHPDLGGDTNSFNRIKNSYEQGLMNLN